MLYHYVVLQAAENVSYTAASAQSSAAPARTTHARVVSTTDVHVRNIGASPTAVVTDMLLPYGTVEFIPCVGGNKLAFIRDAADGSVNVTFVAHN